MPADMACLLAESKRESSELRSKLSHVFDELLSLRQRAEQEAAAKEKIQKALEEQQKINNLLLKENRYLWTTVPHNEVTHGDDPIGWAGIDGTRYSPPSRGRPTRSST